MDTQKHNKDIVEQFSKQARAYSAMAPHHDALERLITMTSACEGDTVLEIACGSGIVACEFAKYTKQVTGIDMTPGMLDQARKFQAKQALDNLTWDLGDVESLPYGDHSFSIVVSRFGFHHFLDPFKVLSEMKRVCTQDGMVLVVDVSLPDSKIDSYNEMERNRDCSHVAALSWTQFSELFEKVGFKKLHTDGYSMRIELQEQLRASFPRDVGALEAMILSDVGMDNLGIKVTEENGTHFLHYPIHIFAAQNGR